MKLSTIALASLLIAGAGMQAQNTKPVDSKPTKPKQAGGCNMPTKAMIAKDTTKPEPVRHGKYCPACGKG